MIRKLLYRFRRMVLVWQLERLRSRLLLTHRLQRARPDLLQKIVKTDLQIAQIDYDEMSKGEAHVVVKY